MMNLYDSKANTVIRVPDYIGRIKLKRDHISKGGKYCLPEDIDRYVLTPVKNVVHTEIVQTSRMVNDLNYPQEVTNITPEGYHVEASDKVYPLDEPVKRRRRKKEQNQ